MNLAQMLLVLAVMLFALTVGIAIANNTREELKPGRKWFGLIAVASIFGIFFSVLGLGGDDKAFYLASFACMLIISMVPLGMLSKKKKKKNGKN